MTALSSLHKLQLALCAGVIVLFGTAALRAQDVPERIVSVGGSVTEIVYALGEQERLVARDTTSNYPQEVLDLPDVGYIRALSAEGMLSVNPTLILTEEGAGPPETVDLLEQAAIPVIEIPDGYDAAAVRTKILAVAKALGVPDKGDALAAKVDAALAEAVAQTSEAAGAGTPRVLFILSMQGGRILAGGQDTAAEGIIHLAGGENAAQGFTGYKPLTDEAVISAAPDVILMMQRNGDLAISDEALFGHPAILSTPAGEARAVVRMDGMKLLGFGPRVAEAATELSRALAAAGS